MFGLDSGGDRLRIQIFRGAQRGDTGSNAAGVAVGSVVKMAANYGASSPLFSVNGATVASAATPSQADFDANPLQIGARNTAGTPSNFLNSFVRKILFLPPKTQAEHNALTA